MKFKEVQKGDWIINTNVPESTPWFVCYKYTGMVVIRRKPKVGKLIALTTRQLCDFIKQEFEHEEDNKRNPKEYQPEHPDNK